MHSSNERLWGVLALAILQEVANLGVGQAAHGVPGEGPALGVEWNEAANLVEEADESLLAARRRSLNHKTMFDGRKGAITISII